MVPVVNQFSTERIFIVVNGSFELISPNALKLLRYLMDNPVDHYATSAIRKGLGVHPRRNLRPYFKELQRLHLVEAEFDYGVVRVSKLARCVAPVNGLPAFEG